MVSETAGELMKLIAACQAQEGDFVTALATAERIERIGARAEALAAIARFQLLAGHDPSETLGVALNLMDHMEDPDKCGSAFALISNVMVITGRIEEMIDHHISGVNFVKYLNIVLGALRSVPREDYQITSLKKILNIASSHPSSASASCALLAAYYPDHSGDFANLLVEHSPSSKAELTMQAGDPQQVKLERDSTLSVFITPYLWFRDNLIWDRIHKALTWIDWLIIGMIFNSNLSIGCASMLWGIQHAFIMSGFIWDIDFKSDYYSEYRTKIKTFGFTILMSIGKAIEVFILAWIVLHIKDNLWKLLPFICLIECLTIYILQKANKGRKTRNIT